MTGATEMRHMNPPKRPPEIHDEPEPETKSEELSTVYKVVTVVLFSCLILGALGAVLSAIQDGEARPKPGMKIERTK